MVPSSSSQRRWTPPPQTHPQMGKYDFSPFHIRLFCLFFFNLCFFWGGACFFHPNFFFTCNSIFAFLDVLDQYFSHMGANFSSTEIVFICSILHFWMFFFLFFFCCFSTSTLGQNIFVAPFFRQPCFFLNVGLACMGCSVNADKHLLFGCSRPMRRKYAGCARSDAFGYFIPCGN